jgi:glycerophosphoryl diester phosphodiesterase
MVIFISNYRIVEAMRRRELIALASALLTRSRAETVGEYRLIAHRGGIVDEDHAENSPGSIEAAIKRRYWMLEVDIRRTSDGEPILQHDPTFKRFYGDERRVEDLTWTEVQRLRSKPGDTSPIHFADLCRMCKGKIRLMLDIKGNNWPAEFYRRLVRNLEQNDLLRSAYLLGGDEVKQFFRGKSWLSSNRKSLADAVARGEDVSKNYFLFELASELDETALQLCGKHNVVPVAAINTFRYTMAHRDEAKGPEEDAARLKKIGVQYYQIDSRYDYLFL